MNVTNPLATHRTQASASTLPIKRGETSATGTGVAKSSTTPASPANPSHLGNTIDTTA